MKISLQFTLALGLLAFAGTSPCLRADDADKEDKPELVREIVIDGPQNKPASEEPPESYDVQQIAAKEPIPALKYRLYPSRGELKPGNSVPFYYRTLIHLKGRNSETRQQLYDAQKKYLSKTLEAFRNPEAHKEIEFATAALSDYNLEHNLKEAVYREWTNWDWQLNELQGTEIISFYLEETQEMREISRILELKARLAAAEGDYDRALEYCLLNFKSARDAAEPPTLINDLIGLAMSSISLAVIRDTICETDCPNLYWALASLPDPLISLNEAMEHEGMMPEIMFPVLKDPETAIRSNEEWSRQMREMFFTVRTIDEGSDSSTIEQSLYSILGSGLVLRSYPVAKRELIAAGYDADKLEKMPVGQVVAIYQKRTTRTLYDEMLKWTYLPYPEALTYARLAERELGTSRMDFQEPVPLAVLLVPAVRQAKSAEVRLQSKIRGLMALEAIRMHAAANDGRLPNSLDEIEIVPVPGCPLTGKLYEYHLEGKRATLVIPTMDLNLRKYWWAIHLEMK